MGANFASKYVGEYFRDCLVEGLVSVSNPYDINITAGNIDNSWYKQRVGVSLMLDEVKRHVHDETYIEYCNYHGINLEDVYNAGSVAEFNNEFCIKVLGFQSNEDYQSHISSVNCIQNIAIPSLFMNTLDDPICPGSSIPYEALNNNPNCMLVTVGGTGHTDYCSTWRKNNWHHEMAVEFFRFVEEKAKKEAEPRPLTRDGLNKSNIDLSINSAQYLNLINSRRDLTLISYP